MKNSSRASCSSNSADVLQRAKDQKNSIVIIIPQSSINQSLPRSSHLRLSFRFPMMLFYDEDFYCMEQATSPTHRVGIFLRSEQASSPVQFLLPRHVNTAHPQMVVLMPSSVLYRTEALLTLPADLLVCACTRFSRSVRKGAVVTRRTVYFALFEAKLFKTSRSLGFAFLDYLHRLSKGFQYSILISSFGEGAFSFLCKLSIAEAGSVE